MIYLLAFILGINILNNLFHKAVINNKSALWHGLSAGIDAIIYTFIGFIIIYGDVKIYHWLDILFITMIALTVRWISRDIMLGVGTTAWMDRNIKGWWRLCIQVFFVFLSVIYIIDYYKYINFSIYY